MSPSLKDMNFSLAGTVAVIILAIAYYLLQARNVYKGPVMEGGWSLDLGIAERESP